MSTRGACGFHKNGVDKITYNHFDSYPGCLGVNILDFINKTTDEELNKIYDNVILVEEDSKPTKDQIKECEKWSDLTVGEQSCSNWYCLLRKSQGNLETYKDGLKYMINSSDFLKDSLFCEYAYVINLDTNELEFYIGGQHINSRNRYHLTKEEKENAYEKYYNCKLVKTFPLNVIRKYRDDVLHTMEKSN